MATARPPGLHRWFAESPLCRPVPVRHSAPAASIASLNSPLARRRILIVRPDFFRISIPLAIVACLALGGRSVAAGTLEPFGLPSHVVTSLGHHGSLYAGTIGEGVFRRGLGDPGGWVSLGLEGKRIRAVWPHASGALGFATSAGLEGNPLDPDSALVWCADMDQLPWAESDSGMNRPLVTAVWSLDGFPSPAICGESFAATVGPLGGVWRREFGGTHWEFVLDLGFAAANVVRVDPASGNVWAGGENAVMSPWIARSTDGGDTWHVAYPFLGGDNACNSIAVHPGNPDLAYAGMEGPVIKTMDGGVTWVPTGLDSTQAYIYGVALDSGSPSHLLAGGMVQNPNNWALWESFDAGETWGEIPPPTEGATGILSILADPARAGTFYLATRGHGVWRYRSPVLGADDRAGGRGVLLAPPFPNPTRSHAALRFEIPPWRDGAPVHLAIYGVRGERVRVLVDGARRAGTHRSSWNGADDQGRIVAPGVYYCRFRAGPLQQTRTIQWLR